MTENTASLAEWTARLTAAKVSERAAIVGAAVTDGSLAGWLLALPPNEAEGWLVTNRTAVGARQADAMRRKLAAAAKDRANAAARAARLERAVQRMVAPLTVGEIMGREDLPRLDVPGGWKLEDGRLIECVDEGTGEDAEIVERFVAHRPIVTTGVLVDLDTRERAIVVEWPDDRIMGSWDQAIVPAAMTQDPRAFISLRNRGAPVAHRNARELAKWLDDLEARNADTIPRAHHTSRLGWQGEGGGLGYMWGRTLLTPDGDIDCDVAPAKWGANHVRLAIPPDDGRAQLADGCCSSGTLDGWLRVIERALPYPRVMLGVYASLASCLLGLVPSAPNAIVDWSGETSRGKTTTLAIAASCWGRPELTGAGVMRTWDVSPAGLEQLAEMAAHMPLILDDTKRATTRDRDASIVSSLIYQIAAGQGRGRARPDGMRRTATWRTILLSTGEAPATSWTQDAGARARVLAIRGSPFPDESGDIVAELGVGVREHYGHAGPALIRTVLKDPNAAARIRAAYDLACDRWALKAGGGAVGGRLAQMLGLLSIGADALHDTLGLPRPPTDPIATVALHAVQSGADEADRPSAALAAAHEWACVHSADFYGRHATKRERIPHEDGHYRIDVVDVQPARGWAGVWTAGEHWTEIAWDPGCLARVLDDRGFAIEDVLPRWDERGWLKAGDGRHLGVQRRIKHERSRFYAITKEAVDTVLPPEEPIARAPAPAAEPADEDIRY